ncbi:hypothetical protein BG015_002467 [Linnemannia schmuckeri]|uniref:BTB domain-containing protein n=1 Tax=Linnemannia schmuckeri TaxID=64567 RepID=A0A9P5RNJ2_9FUNG|nr:hypothetical protein BG015_002467 [Linnemannia schmuckeri]
MSISSPAPKPLPPLVTSDPRLFYTINVSGENFLVSHSALQYDSPNFFTDVFMNPHREEYSSRILYINRNPDVFKDIIKHMQGYYVAARDEVHLENLVMDAHFFKLKRLVENLRQTMFINVSGTIFKVSRETILNDSPNFFALLEPFSDRNLTPTYFCRSPELFKDILSHLQGYEIPIRDKIHRTNLLKEARYFKLNNLISKLSLGTEYVYSGFPTRPEERIKPEVTMVLKNIKVKHVMVKGWREFVASPSSQQQRGNGGVVSPPPQQQPSASQQLVAASGVPSGYPKDSTGGGSYFPHQPANNTIHTSSTSNNPNASTTSTSQSPNLNSSSNTDITMQDNSTKEAIIQANKLLISSGDLQDLLYKPTSDIEPLALLVELTSTELFAVWPGSVNSSMLGDQHLFVYRDQDLTQLNKICKRLGLTQLTMAANVVRLSPNLFFHLDGHSYKGQEELEPIIRKLALSSAQVTPPGRALRLFLGRALVRVGCKAGQLVMTIVKAEGWSSDKEYNACRKYLSDDMRDTTSI